MSSSTFKVSFAVYLTFLKRCLHAVKGFKSVVCIAQPLLKCLGGRFTVYMEFLYLPVSSYWLSLPSKPFICNHYE